MRTITIRVTEWPNAENFDPDKPSYQWDVDVDGEWHAGGTGPGDAISHAYYAIEAVQVSDDSGVYF